MSLCECVHPSTVPWEARRGNQDPGAGVRHLWSARHGCWGLSPGPLLLRAVCTQWLQALLQPPRDAVSRVGGRKSTSVVCKFAFAPHLVTAKFYCVNLMFLSLFHFSVTKLGKNEMKLLKNWKNFRKVCKHF